MSALIDIDTAIKMAMETHDTLDTNVFRSDMSIHQDVLDYFYKASNFVDDYIKRNIKDVELTDVVLQGGITSYLRDKQCDIDIQLIYKHKYLKDTFLRENLKNIVISARNKGYNPRFYDNRPIDFSSFDKVDNISSGVYSLKSNQWLSKPIKKELDFTEHELKNYILKEIDSHNNYIQTILNSSTYPTPLSECDKIRDYFHNIRDKAHKAAINGNKEYDFEYITYRALRKAGEIGKLRRLVTSIYSNSLSTYNE